MFPFPGFRSRRGGLTPGSTIPLGHVAKVTPSQVTPGGLITTGTSSSTTTSTNSNCGKLPLEGKLYDQIGLTNFVDLEKYKLTASLSKSIPSNILSNMLDADLPAKVTFSGKLGTLWFDEAKFEPVGRVALNVRLLDLGASDSKQKGHLRFKASARTNGRRDHGFEIDRKVQIFGLPKTTLYGNVGYKTTNKSNGAWKTTSSFGLHQEFAVAGVKLAGRLGLTPEGDVVYDLRL